MLGGGLSGIYLGGGCNESSSCDMLKSNPKVDGPACMSFKKAITSHWLTRYPNSLSLLLRMLELETSPRLHFSWEVSPRSDELVIAKFTRKSLANRDTRTRRPAPSLTAALTVPVFLRRPS